ncbi:MAG: flavin reductase family protein [Bacteroidota bacterium]|nr:flavin reductase family protein [Bacteroidota bacterium]
MESKLKPLDIKNLNDNVFSLLKDDWMLLTAGTRELFNTMTASWGAFGMLWNKPIAIGFIRPQRYTFDIANQTEHFTLSFFSHDYRKVLNFCGSHSGREVDKIAQTGITPVFSENSGVHFSEARLVLECKKLYVDELKPENFFATNLIKEFYPQNDFHHFFIGEITNCLSSNIR